MHEKSNEVPPIPNENVKQPLNGVISFRIPEVIKGPKNTRFKNAVEKKAGKKKGGQKKGTDLPTVLNIVLSYCIIIYMLHCRWKSGK